MNKQWPVYVPVEDYCPSCYMKHGIGYESSEVVKTKCWPDVITYAATAHGTFGNPCAYTMAQDELEIQERKCLECGYIWKTSSFIRRIKTWKQPVKGISSI